MAECIEHLQCWMGSHHPHCLQLTSGVIESLCCGDSQGADIVLSLALSLYSVPHSLPSCTRAVRQNCNAQFLACCSENPF